MRRVLAVILLAAPFCFYDKVNVSAIEGGAPIDTAVPARTETATFALG
jgi:hypothetical protein